jgi:hypothetical protein
MEKDNPIIGVFKDFIEGKITPRQYHEWFLEKKQELITIFGEYVVRSSLEIKDSHFTENDGLYLYHRVFQILTYIGEILCKYDISFSDAMIQFYYKEAQRILEEERPLAHFAAKIDTQLRKTYQCEFDAHSWAGVFAKRMFKKYQDAGSPRSVLKWIEENVMPEFVCLTAKPVWHCKFGANYWPMGGDNPAVFLGQFDVPEQNVYENHFISGITVYVFGFKIPEEHGTFRVEYITFDHVTNDASQSIEEHYREEEKRMKKEEKQRKKEEKKN